MRITKPNPPESSPLLISASRATDIPAFHSRWLMERLRAGFVDKVNPYNNKPQRINFSRARAIIFWTKNPVPLQPYLPEIINLGLTPYFLFTLNDYETEGWEPNLPPLTERLEAFIRLADRLPPESVAWRFDPIALSGTMSAEKVLNRIRAIHNKIGHCTRKLIFSFVDIYPKVRRRLDKLGLDLREPEQNERRQILMSLADLKRENPSLSICSCAEGGDGELKNYGIERNSCIDAFLLARLCPELANNTELFAPALPGLFGGPSLKPLKDRGQRDQCRCAPSRDIGSYNTCGHGCVYCYANR